MAVQCNIVDTAIHHGPESHTRQVVRNIMRKRPVFTLDTERGYLESIFTSEDINKPKFEYDDQRK
eukprot:7450699-Pyramimonas_sp.AAC.1